METRANYVLIGIFTLAVVVGAFAFVWWLERVGDGGGRNSYEIVFDSSVSGLRPGAPVHFNGIRVGEVGGLRLDRGDPRKVVVTVSVSSSVPVRSDTRASLEYQGLTGIASVAMTGGRPDAPPLVAQAGGVPRMLAEGGQMADLMSGAKQIMGRVDSIAMRIDRLLGDNEARLDQAIKDIAQFTSVLSERSGDVDTLLSNAGQLAKKLNTMADKFDGVLEAVRGFTGDKDNQGFMANASEAARSVRDGAVDAERISGAGGRCPPNGGGDRARGAQSRAQSDAIPVRRSGEQRGRRAGVQSALVERVRLDRGMSE
jgi:phospholipid/cholesterol/gamma-HCH transport system substrate-binding protein